MGKDYFKTISSGGLKKLIELAIQFSLACKNLLN